MPSCRNSAGASTRPRSQGHRRGTARGIPARPSPPGASGAATIGVGSRGCSHPFSRRASWRRARRSPAAGRCPRRRCTPAALRPGRGRAGAPRRPPPRSASRYARARRSRRARVRRGAPAPVPRSRRPPSAAPLEHRSHLPPVARIGRAQHREGGQPARRVAAYQPLPARRSDGSGWSPAISGLASAGGRPRAQRDRREHGRASTTPA